MSWQNWGPLTRGLTVVNSFLFLSWVITTLFLDINYSRNVEGYLKRAGDSNQPATAIKELETALGNMDAAGYCPEGTEEQFTSVIYQTPDEDVCFWRHNLEDTLKDLKSLPPDADALTKSNTLMKVRETLLDTDVEDGVEVTAPDGIAKCPHNLWFALWFAFSLVLWFAAFLVHLIND